MVFAEDLHIEPAKRRATMEILKQMVTGDDQSITNKGVDAESKAVCANFFFTTNFKDTIQKSEGSRRYCMLFTAQQSFDDIARTGLTEEYFNELSRWVDNGHGLEIIAGYLQNYAIPDELNPTVGARRAPITSSTNDAIAHGRTYAEQLIAESVNFQEIGFRGGFVSTRAVSILFKDNNIKRSPHGVADSLKKLGYQMIPSLLGKVIYTGLAHDGANTRLYVLKGSRESELERDMVKDAYVTAQTPPSAEGTLIPANTFKLVSNGCPVGGVC